MPSSKSRTTKNPTTRTTRKLAKPKARPASAAVTPKAARAATVAFNTLESDWVQQVKMIQQVAGSAAWNSQSTSDPEQREMAEILFAVREAYYHPELRKILHAVALPMVPDFSAMTTGAVVGGRHMMVPRRDLQTKTDFGRYLVDTVRLHKSAGSDVRGQAVRIVGCLVLGHRRFGLFTTFDGDELIERLYHHLSNRPLTKDAEADAKSILRCAGMSAKDADNLLAAAWRNKLARARGKLRLVRDS